MCNHVCEWRDVSAADSWFEQQICVGKIGHAFGCGAFRRRSYSPDRRTSANERGWEVIPGSSEDEIQARLALAL